jgi:hypothetical protein
MLSGALPHGTRAQKRSRIVQHAHAHAHPRTPNPRMCDCCTCARDRARAHATQTTTRAGLDGGSCAFHTLHNQCRAHTHARAHTHTRGLQPRRQEPLHREVLADEHGCEREVGGTEDGHAEHAERSALHGASREQAVRD